MDLLEKKKSNIFELDEYSSSSDSLSIAKSKKSKFTLGIILIVLLVAFIVCLIFVPWQQSVTGVGKVTVFSPMERPQTLESQISGRVKQWYVKEGDIVTAGQLLLELEDVDPKFLAENQELQIELQKKALNAKRTAALFAASEKIQGVKNKVLAAEQNILAEKQNLITAELNLDRMNELYSKGLRSKRDLELAENTVAASKAQLQSNQAFLEIAKREENISYLEKDKINAETSKDLFKIDIDLQSIQARVNQRKVISPIDGQITRLLKVGSGQSVKPGDQLAIVSPASEDQAVELYISDHDAPLLDVGRPVRLQFAGWPAIQFTGWPSVAVGTFGGRIAVIDAVDDGRSRFRILVKPDYESIEKGIDDSWPPSKYLRPGAEVIGWVLLDTVSLGFELWRQFNAFPPTVSRADIQQEGKIDIYNDESKGRGVSIRLNSK